MQLAASMNPDISFLDVQMPGATGLDVAGRLPSPQPAVIFCTAYDQHAVDAFELNAVDYLLKPVSRARLAESSRRVSSVASTASIAESSGSFQGQHGYLTRFLVRSGSQYVVVPAQRTACCKSIEGLTRITTSDGQAQ